jgi:hypothetical protein
MRVEGLAKNLEKHSKYLQREFPQSGLGPCSPAIIRFKEEILLAEAQYHNEGMRSMTLLTMKRRRACAVCRGSAQSSLDLMRVQWKPEMDTEDCLIERSWQVVRT